MKKLDFVSLRSDTTFKYLFKTDKGYKWFKKIIETIIDQPIDGYNLYDNELSSGNQIKDNRLDIVLKNKDNNYIIIEMNNCNRIQSIKSRYYLYRIAGKKFNTGDNYLPSKSILLTFNNYTNQSIPELLKANYLLTDQNTNDVLSDLGIYEIYLPNYYKLCYSNCNELEKILYLFECNSFKEMKDLDLDDDSKWIIEELERLSMNNDFINDYDAEEVNKLWTEREKQAGYEEGRNERTNEIIKQMAQLNYSSEEIAKIVNLPVEEIKKIENEEKTK